MEELIDELLSEVPVGGSQPPASGLEPAPRPARVDGMDGSYGEALMRAALAECFPDHVFVKTRQLEWLNGLELDCYCEELRLAAEYQGVQHAVYTPYFHDDGPAKFEAQRERDRRKREAVTAAFAVLIEVPHTVRHCDIRNYVRRATLELGYEISPRVLSLEEFMELARVNGSLAVTMLAKAKEIAVSHGGVCASGVYLGCRIPLSFVCAAGHVFETPLASVNHRDHKRPRFCPECGGTRKRTREENVRDVAQRGYTLLDQFQKRLASGNAMVYFRVRCPEGHEYEVKRDNFISPGDPTAPKKKCIRCERARTNQARAVKERGERAAKFGLIPLGPFAPRGADSEWQCVARGHRFRVSWNTLINRKGAKCAQCS